MKAQNLNNSSRKTRRLIKKIFAEMLSEKKELGKISVSELCKRADISRAYIELDLQIFWEGLLCEYVKYCRGYSDKTLDDLYEYTKY